MTKLCQKNDCCIVEIGYWINKNKKYFQRNEYMYKNQYSNFIKSKNNTGIFSTIYCYDTKDIENAHLYGNMYFDLDCKDDFEKVREDALRVIAFLEVIFHIDGNEPYIYFSGNKGVHIIVDAEILGLQPHKKLNEIFKTVARQANKYSKNKTIDLQIYDNKRLFRIPYSVHEKTGLCKTPLTLEQLRTMDYEDIKELAKSPKRVMREKPKFNNFASNRFKDYEKKTMDELNKPKNIKGNGTLKYMPPCIKNILENGAKEGSRNNSAAVLASFYKNSGKDLETATSLILEWNSNVNVSQSSEIELKRTARSIYSTNKSYGCSTLKDLSECDLKKCRLAKNKKR